MLTTLACITYIASVPSPVNEVGYRTSDSVGVREEHLSCQQNVPRVSYRVIFGIGVCVRSKAVHHRRYYINVPAQDVHDIGPADQSIAEIAATTTTNLTVLCPQVHARIQVWYL